MHSSATVKCSSWVFSILPPYLFPSGEEEVRGEVGGPTEPRSLGGIGEPPSDLGCNRFSDRWDIWLLSAWHLIQMCWTRLFTGQSVVALPTGSRFNGKEPSHQSSQWIPHNHQSEGKQGSFQAKRLLMKACGGHFYSSLADIFNVLPALNLVGFSTVIMNMPVMQRHEVVMKFKCCETFSCPCPTPFKLLPSSPLSGDSASDVFV